MLKKLAQFVFGGLLLLIAVVAGLLTWSHFSVQARLDRIYNIPAAEVDFSHGDIELGHRIVTIRNGCVDCHGKDLGGMKVMSDPAFATIHGPNITPAALASWSDSDILRAIRHGIGKDGRPLLLMPSHEYQYLSEEDLAASVAFLRSVSPVERPNGEIKLGPVAKVLTATGKLPTMITAEVVDHSAGFNPKPPEAPTLEFGRYLVRSACIGCHGPQLRGGPVPGGAPDWPPASDISPPIVSTWTKEQFFHIMRTGISSTGEPIRLPMPVALTAQMNDTELEAMWRFLREEP
jgi:mono/diheme cytochrome c family protein